MLEKLRVSPLVFIVANLAIIGLYVTNETYDLGDTINFCFWFALILIYLAEEVGIIPDLFLLPARRDQFFLWCPVVTSH